MSALPPLEPLEPFGEIEPFVPLVEPPSAPASQNRLDSAPKEGAADSTADDIEEPAVEGTEPAGGSERLATCDVAVPIGEMQIARETQVDPLLAKVIATALPIAHAACSELRILSACRMQMTESHLSAAGRRRSVASTTSSRSGLTRLLRTSTSLLPPRKAL